MCKNSKEKKSQLEFVWVFFGTRCNYIKYRMNFFMAMVCFLRTAIFFPNSKVDSISLTASQKSLSLYTLFPPTPYLDSIRQYLKNRTKKIVLSFQKDCHYGNRKQATWRSAKHFCKRNCKGMSKRRYPNLTGNIFKDTWVLYYFFMYPLIFLEMCDNTENGSSTCKGYQRSCCLQAICQAGKG